MTPDVLQALNEAAQCYGRGDLVRAEAICRQLLLEHPRATDVLHLLGLVRRRQGNPVEAERLLCDCLAREPDRADIRANLGNLLNSLERFAEAEAAYRGALARDPGFRPACLGLARTLLRAGKDAEALLEAEALTSADDADAEAWTVAGSALRSLGHADRAENTLRRAIDLNPLSAVARHNLGALLNDLSRNEEALVELERASSMGLRGMEIDFNVASALMGLNRFDEAEERLARSVATSPQDPRTHRLLARLRFMRGADNYAADLETAVKRFPEDITLRMTHSQVLRGAGLPEAAAETLLAAPDDADPRTKAELAAVYLEAGHFHAACDAARAAVASDPSNPGFPGLLIDSLLVLGRANEAIPLIAAARRRQPANQWYIAAEATAARLLGDPRYESYYDYQGVIHSFELEPPPGWSSIESFHADLIPVLRDRHRFRAQPLDQSLRRGTQTPRGLLGDPDPRVKAFITALAAPIDEYRARVGFDPKHVFRARNRGESVLIGCWSVRLGAGGYHVNHVHPEGWISSAYYVEVPPEVANSAARSGWIKFGEPRFSVPNATPEHFVQPRPGRLVLFPSYMWHGTIPIVGNEPRMTIAFDVIPKRSSP
jgi:Flp pilus assembly protein TadD